MQLEQLGPYRIGRKLGRGGMGTVYEAVEIESGQEAAVKVLSAAMAMDEGFRERFEGEIETLRKLRHPNIVRLFGWGEQNGLLFYVMELVRGTSLEEELQHGRRFDWREVTHIGVQMSRALKHAHDSGVIHRDIKPANLLITPEGDVKLSDFGIAKLFGATGLTADGGVLGTAEYMSPEQADGRPVTYRSDLYSLGGVLYALVAGRPPFRAKSIPEMLQLQRFAEPEPLRRLCYDVPEELAAIVAQLLEKDPEKRIPSAMVLARRLEAMEHGLSVRRDEGDRLKQTIADSDSGPIRISSGSASDSGSDIPLDATRADTEAPVSGPRWAESSALAETYYTAPVGEGYSLAQPAPTTSVTAGPTRFTTVKEEEESEPSALRETVAILLSPQTWLLIGALVMLGLMALYMIQPPTADKLYEQVVALASDESPERLLEAEDQIQTFLHHYPDDGRAGEIKAYADDIELIKLERQFDRRVRLQKMEQSSAVERAYAEAMYLAPVDPQQAIAKLEAMLALYGEIEPTRGKSPLTDTRALAVQLAHKKLARLRQAAKEQFREDLKLLRQQLANADKVHASQPEQARAMWQAIVVLYADKPWAQSVVDQARKRLATHAAADPEAEHTAS